MNKSFKVVKNAQGKSIVASELAKGKRKGVVSALMATLALALATPAFSAPTLVEDGLIAAGSKQAVNGGQLSDTLELIVTAVGVAKRSEGTVTDLSTKVSAFETQVASAQANATKATSSASNAVTTANNASNLAVKANTTATTANTTATQALSNATNAITIANGANATATTANTNAQKAVLEAQNATKLATTANTTASQANTNATLAVTTANNANATAKSASTLATTANNTATNANTNATKANENATKALTNATEAKTLASNANTNATRALTLANNANATAILANTNATEALDISKANRDSIASLIGGVQTAQDTANTVQADLGVLTTVVDNLKLTVANSGDNAQALAIAKGADGNATNALNLATSVSGQFGTLKGDLNALNNTVSGYKSQIDTATSDAQGALARANEAYTKAETVESSLNTVNGELSRIENDVVGAVSNRVTTVEEAIKDLPILTQDMATVKTGLLDVQGLSSTVQGLVKTTDSQGERIGTLDKSLGEVREIVKDLSLSKGLLMDTNAFRSTGGIASRKYPVYSLAQGGSAYQAVLTNVYDGRVASDSTDAINGRQFYIVEERLGTVETVATEASTDAREASKLAGEALGKANTVESKLSTTVADLTKSVSE